MGIETVVICAIWVTLNGKPQMKGKNFYQTYHGRLMNNANYTRW
jgi:hypothetical protein